MTKFEKYLPLLLFAFGIWFFNIRILGWSLEYIPGDFGDSRFVSYILEHGHLWLTGNVDSFWNADFMYPYPGTIAISDNMMGTLPIYSFYRFLGFEMETAYQLWWISITALNYWIAYIILLKWFDRKLLAVIGAFIFAFSIFNIYQIGHAQVHIRFLIPMAFYAAVKLVETGERRYLMIYLASIVVQFYAVIYTGFFLLYFSLGFIVVYTMCTKRWRFVLELFTSKSKWFTMSSVFLSLLLLFILLLPYYRISNEIGLRLYDEVKWNLPVIQAYLFPHPSSIWSFLHNQMKPDVTLWWLQSVFIGILPLLTILSIPFLFIYRKWNAISIAPLHLALGISILCISIIMLRLDNGWTLYALIFKFPGMNSMRALNRFMHVELFLIVVFMLLLLKNRKVWILYALLPIIIADNYFDATKVPRLKKQEWIARKRQISDQVISAKKRDPQLEAFVLINSDIPYISHLDAMMASLETGVPTINGYSGSCPEAFGTFFKDASDEGLQKWMTANKIDEEKILIIRMP